MRRTGLTPGPGINLVLALSLLLSGCAEEADRDVPPPVAERRSHVEVRHGEEVADPYHWLRDREDPAVLAHLGAENDYAAAATKHIEPLSAKIYEEMLGRIRETDLSVPERVGEYYYYSRTEEGRPYRVHCRKRGGLEAEEEILLDVNELATGYEYFRLGVFRVSPNHRMLAYSVDTDGGELFTIHFKDLVTGQTLPESIPGTSWSVRWANDGLTVFYNTRDAARRPYRVYRHVLCTSPEDDSLVYEEKDTTYSVWVGKTPSRKFILIQSESNTSTEIRLVDADTPDGPLVMFAPRRTGVEYQVSHRGDLFYVLTNDTGPNFRLATTKVGSPSHENWTEMIAHREDVHLGPIGVFERHLVIVERRDGFQNIRVVEFQSGDGHVIALPEQAHSIWLGRNPEPDTDLLRFTYTSLLTPRSVYDYDMKSRSLKLLKIDEVKGGYERERYRSERVFAKASDGARVPISLVYPAGMTRDGSAPLYLSGYGAYGASLDPYFSSARLSLLDRGFVVAVAHVRGGGEMGRRWYEAGKLDRKMNSFTDFIACAEHLARERYASPDRIAISGASAGGLLVGAAVNLRPDLFRVVIAGSPFVDVVNTMLDETIPLTAGEWEEWGDPRTLEDYRAMMKWSPYDNVREASYPDMLVTAGLNDPRVGYWEPAKWVARMRARRTNDSLIVLKTNLAAGHSGSSGRYARLKERAFEYAFVLDRLGIRE